MEQKIIGMLSDAFAIDEDEITPESDFMDDLGVDSLEMVELIVDLENEFGIVVENEDLANIKTVGDLVNFVEQRLDQ